MWCDSSSGRVNPLENLHWYFCCFLLAQKKKWDLGQMTLFVPPLFLKHGTVLCQIMPKAFLACVLPCDFVCTPYAIRDCAFWRVPEFTAVGTRHQHWQSWVKFGLNVWHWLHTRQICSNVGEYFSHLLIVFSDLCFCFNLQILDLCLTWKMIFLMSWSPMASWAF